MEDETRTQKKLSILMLPWLAHGHISPYLELSKRLSTKSIHIYFCSTPINLKSIKIPPKYSQSIQLVELHLPSLPNLPPQYHTTKGLPPNLMTTLKQAFDMSSPAFASLLQKLKPDLVIYDMISFWVPSVAGSFNIPAVHFLVFSSVTTSFIIHYSREKNRGETKTESQYPFSSIFVRDYLKPKITHLLDSTANGVVDKDRYFRSYDLSCRFILAKTCTELEAKYIDLLSKLLNKKVIPVGPIIESVSESESETTTDGMILNWLDKKERSSTVFVSFGSEYFLSETERTEIAHGLEQSEVNFIWVVRFPIGYKMEIKEALPDGFHERIKDRGLIIENWAKQGRILKHKSIGGFVSHCGWSSVLESLGSGVPIVAVPMQLDQPLNGRLVEEVGVGVEVVRNETGEIDRDEISRVVREVVVEETGERVRKKVKEISEIMMKKNDQEIDSVVNQLTSLVN